MANKELAKILNEIGDYLEMQGIEFKPVAYRKAAQVLESMGEDIRTIYEKGGFAALTSIPGVGQAIAQKIEEYVQTGRIGYWKHLKKETPVHLEELMSIEGIGPRKIKALYEKLGIVSVKDLEKAALFHKIAGVAGFGETTEQNILQGIRFLKKDTGRFLLGEILPKARQILDFLKTQKTVKHISLAGSIRRMKETIGDVDLLVASDNPQMVMDVFTKIPGIEKIWGKGQTKSSIRLQEGFDVDLRVVSESAFGAALQYFTGSKQHNIRMRTIAMERGMKLNEYGLFKGHTMIKTASEKDIYNALHMDWIPPEIRENEGEIEAARDKALPELIHIKDIQGDLHCHSSWDGGKDSIDELLNHARARGYTYVGIADHTKFLRIEKGLDEKKLLRRNKEIDKMNKELSGFRILKGCEANIMGDGTIDIKDTVLAVMDFVIAGIHSQMKMSEEEMTGRLIKAMHNPHVDIISHPTGRLLLKREAYEIGMEKVFDTARQTNTILEINSFPDRLDLHDRNIRAAKEKGVKMVINTDTHSKEHMRFMEFGIAQARRGWAVPQDVINTQNVEGFLSSLKARPI